MVKTIPLEIYNEVLHWIDITKSDSKIAGYALREAHETLGFSLGTFIGFEEIKTQSSVLVIVKMRSGLCFGLGLARALEKLKHRVHITFEKITNIPYDIKSYNKLIVVDGVINSGKSIHEDLELLNRNDVIVATNVVSSQAIELLKNRIVFAIRQSEKRFVGSDLKEVRGNIGPDTSERLFRSDFFIGV